MTVKERLKQITQLEREIECGLTEIKLLNDFREKLGTVFCSQSRLLRYIKEIEDGIDLLIDTRECLSAFLRGLERPELRRLMKLRYIHGLKWEKICDIMLYSPSQIHRLHRAALSQLENL